MRQCFFFCIFLINDVLLRPSAVNFHIHQPPRRTVHNKQPSDERSAETQSEKGSWSRQYQPLGAEGMCQPAMQCSAAPFQPEPTPHESLHLLHQWDCCGNCQVMKVSQCTAGQQSEMVSQRRVCLEEWPESALLLRRHVHQS